MISAILYRLCSRSRSKCIVRFRVYELSKNGYYQTASFPVGSRTHSRNNIIMRPSRLVPPVQVGAMALLTSTFMDYLVKYVSGTIEDQCTFRLLICADFSDMKSIFTIANSICSIKDIFLARIHCCKARCTLSSFIRLLLLSACRLKGFIFHL